MYQKKVSEIFLRLVRPSEVRSVTSFVLDFPTTRAQFYYCFLFSDLICRALLHSHQCTLLLLPHLLAEKKDGLPAPFFFPERHIFFFFSSSSHNISNNRWRRKRNTYTHTPSWLLLSHMQYTLRYGKSRLQYYLISGPAILLSHLGGERREWEQRERN